MIQGKYHSQKFCYLPSRYVTIGIVLLVLFVAIDLALKVRRIKREASSDGTVHTSGFCGQLLRALRPAMVLWCLPGLASLIALGYWCSLGLYSGDARHIHVLCTLALASIIVPLLANGSYEWGRSLVSGLRRCCEFLASRVKELMPTRNGRTELIRAKASNAINHRSFFRGAFSAAFLFVTVLLSDCALEVPWNDQFSVFGASFFAIETAIILLVTLIAYFVCMRHGFGVAAVSIACWIIGVAQYFVIMFKGVSIQPSDLLAIGTAAEVGSSYVYVINNEVLSGLGCALLAILLSSLLSFLTVRENHMGSLIATHQFGSLAVNLGTAIVCSCLLVGLIKVPNYENDFAVALGDWDTGNGFKTYGFIPSFIQTIQRAQIHVPDGYTPKKARATENRYAKQYDDTLGSAETRLLSEQQFAETKPTVIAVMNETFSDLSIFDNIRNAGYDGPQYLKYGLNDALSKGALDVSVQGGGTCNSEFEFLTGYSMGLVGATDPYVNYHLDNVGGLVKQFKKLGYDTTAIHPNLASNWNRQSAYKELGFNRFLDIDDFPKDAPKLHAGVTDAATYQKVLEQISKSDKPQFILDVTMQNHGGYSMNNIPADMQVNYQVEGGDTPGLNEYISCINASDKDLEAFIEQLRTLNRPVVLVFFGDHQPGLSPDFNNAYYTNEDELTHAERAYQTVYTIWANYDVAGNEQTSAPGTISTSCLAANLMYQIGGPLSKYQKAQLVMSSTIPQINALGYQDAAGNWHKFEDAKGTEKHTLNDLDDMFYLEFGSKVQ